MDNLSLPSSPPPTYRSRASTTRPGLHITFPMADNSSRPPTYRSHISESGGRSRPALPMSDSASASDDNTVNPHSVQVTIESHGTGGRSTMSNSTQSTLGTSRHTTPPRGPEDTMLNRAAQVVQYLDNILQSEGIDSTDTTSRSNTPSASASRKSSVDNGARKQNATDPRPTNGASASTPPKCDKQTKPDVGACMKPELEEDDDKVADTPL